MSKPITAFLLVCAYTITFSVISIFIEIDIEKTLIFICLYYIILTNLEINGGEK